MPEMAFAFCVVENGFVTDPAFLSANVAPLATVIGLPVKLADATFAVHAPDCTVMPENAPES